MYRTSVPFVWRNTKSRNCLVANKCTKCNNLIYPKKPVCSCGNDALEEIKLSGKGKIVTYSQIHSPLDHLQKYMPYNIAIIQLDEGPKITGQVIDSEKINIGMEVEACLRKIFEDSEDGMINYGMKWRVK